MDRLVMTQGEEARLPKIRDDLKLLETSADEDGSKRWLLFDAIQNKYFTIGQDAFELISQWQSDISLDVFLQTIKKNHYAIDKEALQTFIDFLISNHLVVCDDARYTRKMIQAQKQSHKNIFMWLIHNYLFIRIPLFKPDAWLENNKHRVNFFYTTAWQNSVLFLGFVGIVFVLRDWENFISTFMYLFSKEGFFYYFLSLVFVKSFHELGHAFTAKRFGCQVPTMGVAFLVLFPVLYTDTTDAWKLKSKYQRLKIVMAGMKVELYLALLATFLWSFTSEGIFKSILFIVATTSWMSSLLVNISPFLRFDGYYVLSDITNSKNLQPRSFAMAKWFIRKSILGIDEAKPEYLEKQKEIFFIVYALCTWVYRLFLFLGIALLVYHFTFKVLGIILFLVEIIWFIALPIYKEIGVWWDKRKSITCNKQNLSALALLGLILFILFVPWNSRIKMPAIIESKNYFEFYPSEDGYIESIHFKNGENITNNQLLLTIKSPLLEHKMAQVKEEIALIELEISRQAGLKETLDRRFVLEERLLKKINEYKGLEKTRDKLEVRAHFDGKIYFYKTFREQQWVSKKEPIFALYDTVHFRIVGFCNENEFAFLKEKSDGKFIFNAGNMKDIQVKLTTISKISLPYLEFPELSSDFGGEIATRFDAHKRVKTEQAYYKMMVDVEEKNLNLNSRQQGILVTSGESLSLFSRVFKKVASILIRESGF